MKYFALRPPQAWRPGCVYANLPRDPAFAVSIVQETAWKFEKCPAGHSMFLRRNVQPILRLKGRAPENQSLFWSDEGTSTLIVKSEIAEAISNLTGFDLVQVAPEVTGKGSESCKELFEVRPRGFVPLDLSSSGIQVIGDPCPYCGHFEKTKGRDGLVLAEVPENDVFSVREYPLHLLVNEAFLQRILAISTRYCCAFRLSDIPFREQLSETELLQRDVERLINNGFSSNAASQLIKDSKLFNLR